MLAVDRDEQPTAVPLCVHGEVAGGDEALLVREREGDAVVERPERRRQSCESDHRVEHDVRL